MGVVASFRKKLARAARNTYQVAPVHTVLIALIVFVAFIFRCTPMGPGSL